MSWITERDPFVGELERAQSALRRRVLSSPILTAGRATGIFGSCSIP